jgi:C1A family cysteine protease
MPTDQFLADLQEKIAASDEVSWEAGVTSLHDLSDEDMRKRLGAVPPPGEMSLAEREKKAAEKFAKEGVGGAPGYPPSIDWRYNNGNYVDPVLDQGQCGSCVAFGTCGAIQSQMRINKSFRVDSPLGRGAMLSEAQLYFCNSRTCSAGWWPSSALDAAKQTGVVPASDFPYSDHDQTCNLPSYWPSHVTQLSGWNSITSTNDMKTWLATKGPLITAFTVYQDFYSYSGGVYKHVSGNLEGGHCVVVIGYDEQLQAWLCQNSWGTGWGIDGYFWIAYGQCGIDADMWEVTGFSKTYFDWMGDSQIQTTRPSTPKTSSWPALAMNTSNNLLYLVYRSSADSTMWWSWSDGNIWYGDAQIQTTRPSTPKTSAAPALALYNNNKLYLVYRSSADSTMWYSWFDGTTWNGDTQIKTSGGSTPKTSAAPALAVYNNKLYLVYRSSSNSTMYYAWFDGTNWNGDTQIKTAGGVTPKTGATPGLAVYNNKLYIVYHSSADSTMWYAWFDGTNWNGDTQIKTSSKTPKTSASPSLAVNSANNTLYLVYKSSADSTMWWSWFNGTDWQGDVQLDLTNIVTPKTSDTPALAVNSGNKIYMVYRSSADDTMWWAALPGYVT